MNHQLDIFTRYSPPEPTTTSDSTPIEARRLSTVHFNTTEKKGEELEEAQTKCSKQTEKILRLFQQHPRTGFTPWDVHYQLGQQMMITSIRRAMTTLTDSGYLVKTGERRRSGPAGETSYTWRLKAI